MLTVEALRAYGADTDVGVGRCMGMADFYLQMVGMAIADDKTAELEAALTANDLDRAFEVAHAMKGVFANLALTPLTKPVSEMTELLRSRTKTDYSALMAEIKTQFAALCAL